jgi:two-component system, LuxR family, response regulator FixJ
MVFIIDDDQNVRDGFAMLLKSAGYECSSFESAEEFLKNYKAGANDLLILDIHLSGMNGNSLLEYLVKKGLHLLVIIITAYDEKSSRQAAKNYGALAYLRKPVDSEALIDLVKYHLDIQIPNHNNISSQSKRSNV